MVLRALGPVSVFLVNLVVRSDELRKILKPVSEKRSFTALSIWEGFEGRFDSGHCMRLGIDANSWIARASAIGYMAYRTTTADHDPDNPELYELVKGLAALLGRSVLPIFAFEDPGTVAYKNGNAYVVPDQPLLRQFQELIEAFGFFWFTSENEPLAALGCLCQHGRIDAVMTDSYEALIFGADSIISSIWDTGVDQVDVHNLSAFMSNPRLRLGREGLFLIAILLGGEADQRGLEGCGQRMALAISRTGLAKSLFDAVVSWPSDGNLEQFLHRWRTDLRILLATDPRQELRGFHSQSLVRFVTDHFPSVRSLRRYAKPFTTAYLSNNALPDTLSFDSQEPHIADIAHLCDRYFFWGFYGTIIPHLRDLLWPGTVFRHFLQMSLDNQPRLMHERPHRAHTAHTNFSHNPSPFRIAEASLPCAGPDADGPGLLEYVVEIASDAILINAVSHGLGRSLDERSRALAASVHISSAPFSCRIPMPVVEAATPDLASEFGTTSQPTM